MLIRGPPSAENPLAPTQCSEPFRILLRKGFLFTPEESGESAALVPKKAPLYLAQIQEETMKLEFLQMEGCPHARPMLEALRSAVKRLPFTTDIELLDVAALARNEDIRAGYGSPTVLVDGRDLFHAGTPSQCLPSCRIYSPSLPSADDILQGLLNYIHEQQVSPERTKEVQRKNGE